jgi:hypothetical protein
VFFFVMVNGVEQFAVNLVISIVFLLFIYSVDNVIIPIHICRPF